MTTVNVKDAGIDSSKLRPDYLDGIALLSIVRDGEVISEWDEHAGVERHISYADKAKLNVRVSYTMPSSMLASMIREAYDLGKRDQQKSTARQLRSILGV